jgi:hypothetical protein
MTATGGEPADHAGGLDDWDPLHSPSAPGLHWSTDNVGEAMVYRPTRRGVPEATPVDAGPAPRHDEPRTVTGIGVSPG